MFIIQPDWSCPEDHLNIRKLEEETTKNPRATKGKRTAEISCRKGLLQKSDFFKLPYSLFKKRPPDPAEKFYEKTDAKQ